MTVEFKNWDLPGQGMKKKSVWEMRQKKSLNLSVSGTDPASVNGGDILRIIHLISDKTTPGTPTTSDPDTL